MKKINLLVNCCLLVGLTACVGDGGTQMITPGTYTETVGKLTPMNKNTGSCDGFSPLFAASDKSSATVIVNDNGQFCNNVDGCTQQSVNINNNPCFSEPFTEYNSKAQGELTLNNCSQNAGGVFTATGRATANVKGSYIGCTFTYTLTPSK